MTPFPGGPPTISTRLTDEFLEALAGQPVLAAAVVIEKIELAGRERSRAMQPFSRISLGSLPSPALSPAGQSADRGLEHRASPPADRQSDNRSYVLSPFASSK